MPFIVDDAIYATIAAYAAAAAEAAAVGSATAGTVAAGTTAAGTIAAAGTAAAGTAAAGTAAAGLGAEAAAAGGAAALGGEAAAGGAVALGGEAAAAGGTASISGGGLASSSVAPASAAAAPTAATAPIATVGAAEALPAIPGSTVMPGVGASTAPTGVSGGAAGTGGAAAPEAASTYGPVDPWSYSGDPATKAAEFAKPMPSNVPSNTSWLKAVQSTAGNLNPFASADGVSKAATANGAMATPAASSGVPWVKTAMAANAINTAATPQQPRNTTTLKPWTPPRQSTENQQMLLRPMIQRRRPIGGY